MAKTKIPTRLKVGARTIKVIIGTIDNDLMGYYSPMEHAIYISSRLNRAQTVETFWHETIHAVFDYIRFRLDMVTEMNDKDTPEEDAYKLEERTAENFALTFMQVIQDNKLADLGK